MTTSKIETPGTIRALAEDDAFSSLGSSEHAYHDRLVHFSAYLNGFESGYLENHRLARRGLQFEKIINQENGKANVMCLLELGRWAKHHGIQAMKKARDFVDQNDRHQARQTGREAAAYATLVSSLAALPKEEG